jgi:hypothetical protein
MDRARKDASPSDIGTYGYDDGYEYGALSILADGSVVEIPHTHAALATEA